MKCTYSVSFHTKKTKLKDLWCNIVCSQKCGKLSENRLVLSINVTIRYCTNNQ